MKYTRSTVYMSTWQMQSMCLIASQKQLRSTLSSSSSSLPSSSWSWTKTTDWPFSSRSVSIFPDRKSISFLSESSVVCSFVGFLCGDSGGVKGGVRGRVGSMYASLIGDNERLFMADINFFRVFRQDAFLCLTILRFKSHEILAVFVIFQISSER